MLTPFKILTVTVISLTFIFRLLFLNTCLFSTPTAAQSKSTTQFSALKKRQSNSSADVKPSFDVYSALEFCEESSDTEEDSVKSNTPILLSFLGTFFKNIESPLESFTAFDSIKCNLYPKKYLVLSILRI